jgi:hypothetical protein
MGALRIEILVTPNLLSLLKHPHRFGVTALAFQVLCVDGQCH